MAAKKAREALNRPQEASSAAAACRASCMDCTTRERDKSELFLVEGDSAGGSPRAAATAMFQAILPLAARCSTSRRPGSKSC